MPGLILPLPGGPHGQGAAAADRQLRGVGVVKQLPHRAHTARLERDEPVPEDRYYEGFDIRCNEGTRTQE